MAYSAGVRRSFSHLALGLCLSGAAFLGPFSDAASPPAEGAFAPPPAAPALRRENVPQFPANSRGGVRPLGAPSGRTLYSIGEPTDEEQLYLEYINRARRDPAAEAVRLQTTTDTVVLANYNAFKVDLDLMAQQISSLSPAPPFSMNAQLLAVARGHSADMLAHAFQGHVGSDGSTFGTRATEGGYQWQGIAENVFANARSVEHGHAGFEVDWGGDGDPASGGMQTPPGHRLNIHDPGLREAGIGVIQGTNGGVGPWLVTQDFGNRFGLTPFVTGVAYYDLNTNAFYDAGEGVGGITVLAEGSDSYAVTARSGGYSLPVPGDGTYPVTFQVPNMPEVRTTVTVAGGNVKLDHVMTYNAPAISGPETAFVNQDNAFAFTPVGGATGYQCMRVKRLAQPAIEGAEQGLAQVTATTSGSYSVIDSVVKASGKSAFHLAHPWVNTNAPPEDQFLVLNRLFRVGPAGRLIFASRLGWATEDQVARAQISWDGGFSWQDVWSQAGTGKAGDVAFAQRTISLAPFASREVSVRFVYEFAGGGFFEQTDPGVGFNVDNIQMDGCEELVDQVISETPGGTSFTFSPAEVGAFGLRVRPKVGDRLFPWGPLKLVAAEISTLTSLRFTSVEKLSGGNLQFGFAVVNPKAGASYRVEGATDLTGPWANELGVTIEPATGQNAFRAIIPRPADPRRFYRVAVN